MFGSQAKAPLLINFGRHNEFMKPSGSMQHVMFGDHPTVKNMLPGMTDAASMILSAAKSGRQIIARYHNDADGITSGLALMALVGDGKFYSAQARSAVYSLKEAIEDVHRLGGTDKPLAIFADFAANAESASALSLLHGAGVEIIIIDHHPFSEEAVKHASLFVSPHKHGDPSASHYAAGFLCSQIAMLGGCEKAEMERLAKISLCGDRSKFAPSGKDAEEFERAALVLDFLVTYSHFPNTLEFYGRVLSDKNLLSSMHTLASEKLSELAATAKRLCKVQKLGSGVSLVLVPLDKLTRQNEFPSKGKASGAAFDAFRNGLPLVAVGFGEQIINFRASPQAIAAGFSAQKLILAVKGEIKDGIEAGGGHDAAASMRIVRGFEPLVLDEVVKRIKEQFPEK